MKQNLKDMTRESRPVTSLSQFKNTFARKRQKHLSLGVEWWYYLKKTDRMTAFGKSQDSVAPTTTNNQRGIK